MATVRPGQATNGRAMVNIRCLFKGCRGKVPGVTAWEDNRRPFVIGTAIFSTFLRVA